ncbi:MAG: Mov34/MPN/PAD-1 family protein [Anaerolineales bacterium]|jgi:proteasome lid subunit RPN8/RPN11
MIQLSKQESVEEQTSHIPYERARRWWSDVEEERRPSPISMFVTQKAYVRICAHAGSDLENEVGGWMVGKQRTDNNTGEGFIVVEAVLPAVHVDHGSAHLTFTQDSQVAMYAMMEERYPGKDLVGWYHTHPKMGIFLSKYDHWLHKNFFKQPWQVALVVEPHSNVAGFFTWDSEGKLDTRYYYGFYEINNGQARSVVHWKNMSPKPVSDVEGG